MALGSEPLVPPIDGINSKEVVKYSDILDGNVEIKNKKVVVGGGGLVGCETALYLASQGNDVSIIEMLPDIAMGMEPISKNYLLNELKELNVKVYTNSKLISVSDKKAKFDNNGSIREIDFDNFIIAFGGKPLSMEFKSNVEVRYIGDSMKIGKIVEAVRDGYIAGYES
jgi:pyruvate/2-oxoglutarate dehydrogenase complex dihydrolipoamide dehydrogenase (E3) component